MALDVQIIEKGVIKTALKKMYNETKEDNNDFFIITDYVIYCII